MRTKSSYCASLLILFTDTETSSPNGGSARRKASAYTRKHKHRQTSISVEGFEPTTPMFERPKRVYSSAHEAYTLETSTWLIINKIKNRHSIVNNFKDYESTATVKTTIDHQFYWGFIRNSSFLLPNSGQFSSIPRLQLNLQWSLVYWNVCTVALDVIFLRHSASVYFGITVRVNLKGCALNGQLGGV
jgi:hypothetical protein